jgi:tetratricopeptide (TPR) repeat protein
MKIPNRCFIKFLVALMLLPGCRNRNGDDAVKLMSVRTLGLAYLEEFKLEEAEQEFRKFTAMAPGDKFGYANLGLTFLRMGRFPEAEEKLHKALSIDSTDADIRLILATVYRMNEQAEKSIAELKKALTFNPGHSRILYEISDLYSNDNRPEAKASRKNYLRKLIQSAPANLVPRLSLTDILIKSGDFDKAMEQLEEIRKLFPDFPKESAEFYIKTINAIRKGNRDDADFQFTVFHNYLKVTPPYQAGMMDLKGPGGSLIGFPLITFDKKGATDLQGDMTSVIKFTDVTENAGIQSFSLNNEFSDFSHVEAADYDGDGDIDLYAGSYDPTTSSFRHWLYNNNSGRFTDVSEKAGLNHKGNEKGAIFGDYDNDGYIDMYIIREDGDILYRNLGNGKFEDVTARANTGSSTWANNGMFVDADHDGDLDLFLACSKRNLLFRNNSYGTFSELGEKMQLAGEIVISPDAAAGDFDEDGDIDIVVINENESNHLYSNQRQEIFKDVTDDSGLKSEGGSAGVAVRDYNNDGFQDLFIASIDGPESKLYRNPGNGRFIPEKLPDHVARLLKDTRIYDSEFLDFDNDGYSDLLIAGGNKNQSRRGLFLFRNDGKGNFSDASDVLPANALSGRKIAVFDYNGDGDEDIAIALPQGGVSILRNDGGNNNHFVKISLVGLRAGSAKNNHFGIGAKIEVRAGDLYQSRVVDRPDLQFGLGNRSSVDVIRITWTNGVPQNIFFPTADQALIEAQTLKGSCPFLYTWNGEKYVFVKDIMWRSGLGMPLGIMGGSTSYSFADASDDYLKIDGDLLKPVDGKYSIQVTSELWETIYMDKLQLVAVDHPDTTGIYVEEQFTPPPFPGMKIFHAGKLYLPASAIDSDGNDVLQYIKEKDDIYLSDFTPAKYQGTTAIREIILDPGIPGDDLIMYLDGWIFPTDASINVAISQNPDYMVITPVVQLCDKEGKWQTVSVNMGFPMGKNKTVIADLRGKFLSADHRIKIRTNMEIYWDRIFFTKGLTDAPMTITKMNPVSADLHFRGFSSEYRKGGRYGPHWFDYSQVSKEAKWRDLTGKYTRYGDVLALLLKSDNKYIISNAGDETTVQFDAANLPELKKGWRRDFLVNSVGWVKDGDLNTAYGSTVLPLPFHGMKAYPPAPEDRYPVDQELQEYNEVYNTRLVTQEAFINDVRNFTSFPQKISFTDVTKQAGIDFRYTIGDYSYVNILESSGSGITVFDYNNDGFMDILMLNGTWLEGISDINGKAFRNTTDKLYKNNGDGTFTDVTKAAGLTDTHWSMSAAPVDYDHDGDQDLFLLNYGPNFFFRNNGDGTFTDITGQTGLRGPEKLNGFTKWSIGASYLDYNKDGLVDVMVGNFLAFDPVYNSPVTPGEMPHPSEYKGQASILYEQKPDGSFKDVSSQAGIFYPDSKCMGLTVLDYDDDGDQDIFQANDHHLNYLFHNDNGHFTETGRSAGIAANSKGVGTGSMHAAINDIDGDGLIDILVTDLDYGALYHNLGKGIFGDVTWQSGVAWSLTGKGGWGSALFDFDNDGDFDLVSANGTAEVLIPQFPLLMENDGKGHFRDIGKEKGEYFRTKHSGRGLAVLDFDNDGDPDVLISHIDNNGTPALLRNDGGNENHWLGITLTGSTPASAIAAKVTVTAGGKKRVFINQWATSYLSNNDPRLHIGLGKNMMAEMIEIAWNDGKKEVLRNVAADRYLTVKEGKGIQ